MKLIGLLLLVFGFGPVVMDVTMEVLGFELAFLAWTDHWGVEIGRAIRAVMIVLGFLLMLFRRAEQPVERRPRPPEWTPMRGNRAEADPLAEFYNKPRS